MAQIRQAVLILVLIGAMRQSTVGGYPQKFFPDDPIQAMPAPLPVIAAVGQSINPVSDFLNSKSSPPPATPAGAVNTIGEVPDSEWFINRHGRVRMSRAELQREGSSAEGPVPPFKVIGGKKDGIMPGFRMQDSKGRLYFVKGDPIDSPELATAAEAIVSRFLYAVGYNTPKNNVVDMKLSDLRLSSKARITLQGDRSREMTWKDVETFGEQVAKRPDGSLRVIASLGIEGEIIGPFRYEGTRPDDPNDITPHENRRDLRGLYVFSAWLNHTDAKAGNTLDAVIEKNGSRFICHYLLDFGSALGSDGDSPKDARLGHEFMLGTLTETVKQVLMLGLTPKEWERVEFPKLRGIGNFESQSFDPDNWKTDYPNRAFLSRLPDDDFWAAKQVMAFTDDDIRAIVETARFSDPRSTEYMIATLAERRNKIGRAFFSKVLPLDHFRIENGELLFDDLAVQYGFRTHPHYRVRWFRFSNVDEKTEPIAANESTRLPVEAVRSSRGSYFSATINAPDDPHKLVSIYFRKEKTGYKLVGIDRTW